MVSHGTALNLFLICALIGVAALGASVTLCRKADVKLRGDFQWQPWTYVTRTGVCLFYVSQALVLAALYFLVQIRG